MHILIKKNCLRIFESVIHILKVRVNSHWFYHLVLHCLSSLNNKHGTYDR